MGTINLTGSLRYDMHGRKRKTKALSTPKKTRGFSSVGRAPALHAGGREFDSRKLHQSKSMSLGSHDAKAALEQYKMQLNIQLRLRITKVHIKLYLVKRLRT